MIPASIRNRNPGAMYPGASAKKFGSTSYETLRSKDGVHKIATFPTHIHGAAAHFDLLNASYTGMTLEKAITRWCGGYYASTYLKVLKDRTGVDADTVLTKAMLADHAIAIPIAKAMAWQEAGQDYPLKDEEWMEAHQMAMGAGTSAPEWNPRNDVPTPKPETRRAAVVAKVQSVATKVGAGVAAGGAAVSTVTETVIPPVPKGITDTIANFGAWGKALPLDNWKLLLAGAATFGVAALVMKAAGR